MIIDFAVGDQMQGAGFVREGLLTAGQVDDGESAHGEPGWPADDMPFVVGPPVHQRAHHTGEQTGIGYLSRLSIDEPCDTAHAASLLRRATAAQRKLGTNGHGVTVARPSMGPRPRRRRDRAASTAGPPRFVRGGHNHIGCRRLQRSL